MRRHIAIAVPKHRGFTLVELLVALVILALIAAIALPSYSSYATRTYRAQGQADLLLCAQGLERFAAINFTYANSADTDSDGVGDADDGPIAAEICMPRSQLENRYQLSVSTTGSGFVLTATPQAGQAADGLLQLADTGQRFWDQNNDGDTTDTGEDSWEDHGN